MKDANDSKFTFTAASLFLSAHIQPKKTSECNRSGRVELSLDRGGGTDQPPGEPCSLAARPGVG